MTTMAIKERNQRRKDQKAQGRIDAEPFHQAEDVPQAETIADLKKTGSEAPDSGEKTLRPKTGKKALGTGVSGGKTKSARDSSLSLGERIQLRWGNPGAKTVLFFIRAALLVLFVVVASSAAATVAGRFIPELTALLYGMVGVSDEWNVVMVAVMWGAPVLFVTAVLFGLYWVVMRALWRFTRRTGDSARSSLLGTS